MPDAPLPARAVFAAAMAALLAACLVSCTPGAAVTRGPDAAAARGDGGMLGDFSTVEPIASGASIYVSGLGDDDNSGTSERDPLRTLQHASDLVKPGDTVFAMDGVYRSGPGTNVLEIGTSGSPDAWIRFMALPGHTPVVRVDENWGGISIGGASYILIDGFTVTGGAQEITRDEAFARADDLDSQRTTANCIGATPASSDASRKPHHVIIRNNVVSNCPGGGIFTNQSDYVRIEDNVVTGNAHWSPWGNSGISVYQNWNSDASTGTKFYIRRNVCSRNESIVPTYISNPDVPEERTITDGNGIIVDDSRNTQSYSSTPGSAYTGRTMVENNLVYDNGGRGITVYSSDHVTVRYNTSSDNARSASIDSEFSVTDAMDVVVNSNIIVASGSKISAFTAAATAVAFANNLYFGGSSGYPGGRVADPRFLDPATGDFRVAVGSPAADAADTEPPKTDLSKRSRPDGGAPDIGAYEQP